MSFKLGRFFYLAISFVIGTFFFVLGAFSIVLPWSVFLQSVSTRFILQNTLILSLFGFGFVLMGLSIVIYTILNTRRRYIHIRTGERAVTIDQTVVQQYLESYWHEHFPKSPVSFQLSIKKQSIQIIADLPALPLHEQKVFLEHVKQDFSELFSHQLGYPYDVHLIASFQADKTSY